MAIVSNLSSFMEFSHKELYAYLLFARFKQ